MEKESESMGDMLMPHLIFKNEKLILFFKPQI